MTELRVENISKEFSTPSGSLAVLRDVSFQLETGQNVAIVGPSGSGKSTLLSIIGSLDVPTAGRVILNGQDTTELSEPAVASYRNQQIGFVFQEHYLLPQCTTLENVLVPSVASGPVRQETLERAQTLLDRVGLVHRLDHRPAELSGGERQRVAVARALINRPALLLADEPTGNLDRSSAARLGEVLLQLQNQEEMMLVVVTHSERLAGQMSRQLELDDGRLTHRDGN